MKFLCVFISLYLLFCQACSLPPERQISLRELEKSQLAYYQVEENMDGILKELNSKGYASFPAKYFEKDVFIKVYITSDKGLVVEQYETDLIPEK